GALGRALMITSGSVTNRVDNLEDRDLIRRIDDPDDRRGVLIELTPRGLRAVDAALEHHVATERDLIDALTPAQRTQLADLLRRLLLAAGDDLVGISHECDFPDAIRDRPVLTRSRIDTSGSSRAIDTAVRAVIAG